MRRPTAAVLAAALLLTTAACGDDGQDEAADLEGVTVSGALGELPDVETTEDFQADDLTSAEVVVGDGDEIADDTVVEAKLGLYDREGNYLQGNFDGEATERIDLTEPGAPWVQELVGANIGSRVVVAVPVSDVLGPQGAPQAGLEPDDPMLFLVDVLREAEPPLEAPEGEAVEPPTDAPKVVGDEQAVTALDFGDAPRTPPRQLQVIPLIEGTGPEVQEGQQVTVNYFASVWGKGDAPFDNSYERGEPTTFPLAKGNLIDGWVQGLEGVPVGSRVMLIIPPRLGYGAEGGGPDIPGNATLVFVIDVLAAA
jgi:peptidylprolyl isomerase